MEDHNNREERYDEGEEVVKGRKAGDYQNIVCSLEKRRHDLAEEREIARVLNGNFPVDSVQRREITGVDGYNLSTPGPVWNEKFTDETLFRLEGCSKSLALDLDNHVVYLR